MSEPNIIASFEAYARRSFGRRGSRAVCLLRAFIEAGGAGVSVTEAAAELELSKSTISGGWLREGRGSFNQMVEAFGREVAQPAGFFVLLSRAPHRRDAPWVLTIEGGADVPLEASEPGALLEHMVGLAQAWAEDAWAYARILALRSDDRVRDFLAEARPLVAPFPEALPAFCVVASLYLDEKWPSWVDLYREDRLTAARTVAILDNPHEHLRPALRAMLAVERFTPRVRGLLETTPLSHTGRRLFVIADEGGAREHIERIAAGPPPDGPKASQVLAELRRPTFAERLLLE